MFCEQCRELSVVEPLRLQPAGIPPSRVCSSEGSVFSSCGYLLGFLDSLVPRLPVQVLPQLLNSLQLMTLHSAWTGGVVSVEGRYMQFFSWVTEERKHLSPSSQPHISCPNVSEFLSCVCCHQARESLVSWQYMSARARDVSNLIKKCWLPLGQHSVAYLSRSYKVM